MKQLGERGAYPLLRLTFSGGIGIPPSLAAACTARGDLGAGTDRGTRVGAV